MDRELLECKAKNGQIKVYANGRVEVGRKGWFGQLYQLFTRGCTEFDAAEITGIRLKEPGWMRGYLRIETTRGGCTVWLTRQPMLEQAQRLRAVLEKKREEARRSALPQ